MRDLRNFSERYNEDLPILIQFKPLIPLARLTSVYSSEGRYQVKCYMHSCTVQSKKEIRINASLALALEFTKEERKNKHHTIQYFEYVTYASFLVFIIMSKYRSIFYFSGVCMLYQFTCDGSDLRFCSPCFG